MFRVTIARYHEAGMCSRHVCVLKNLPNQFGFNVNGNVPRLYFEKQLRFVGLCVQSAKMSSPFQSQKFCYNKQVDSCNHGGINTNNVSPVNS